MSARDFKHPAFAKTRSLMAALFICALLAGCSAKTPQPQIVERPGEIYPPALLTHIADFDRFPQDLQVYAQNAPNPDLRGEQAQTAATYRALFFQPWEQTSSSTPLRDAAWAERSYASRDGYDARGEVIPWSERDAVSANARYSSYPGLADHGIITQNALMRAMPTTQALYGNPAKAGQGFPFDNYQMTALWVGTPVFVSHSSADGKWLFCETALCSGWVETKNVAQTDETFMNAWASAPLYAVTRDNLTLPNGIKLRIGSLLPVRGKELLLPKRDGSGRAQVARTRLPEGLTPFPLPFSPKAFATLGNQTMGRPYGWGGAFFERDCSSLLRDLFTPFGVWLPRNSASQLKTGLRDDLSKMPGEAKAAWLASNARPFRTIVGMPGHVTLYLGQYKGQGVIFNSVWGVRTMNGAGEEGRAVLGKVCVTSFLPGKELPEAMPDKLLLYRFTTAATILGGGGY